MYQIAVKYYPGVCGIDTQQFGCSVSTDNWVTGTLSMSSCITSWTSDFHSALVKVICLNSECSCFCKSMHHGKNIAESLGGVLVSTVPCKRTVYRMVENAESRAHCWSKYEIQNLRFSQTRRGILRTSDRNTHRQHCSCRGYKSLSPVPWFPSCDLNFRTWPAGTSLWGLCLRKKQIPTVTLNRSFHFYSVNWQKRKCRTSHFFLQELKDFFKGRLLIFEDKSLIVRQ